MKTKNYILTKKCPLPFLKKLQILFFISCADEPEKINTEYYGPEGMFVSKYCFKCTANRSFWGSRADFDPDKLPEYPPKT